METQFYNFIRVVVLLLINMEGQTWDTGWMWRCVLSAAGVTVGNDRHCWYSPHSLCCSGLLSTTNTQTPSMERRNCQEKRKVCGGDVTELCCACAGGNLSFICLAGVEDSIIMHTLAIFRFPAGCPSQNCLARSADLRKTIISTILFWKVINLQDNVSNHL